MFLIIPNWKFKLLKACLWSCIVLHISLIATCLSVIVFLYFCYTDTAGVPEIVPYLTIDNDTNIIDGNNVTLTLSWGEPFNNFDPIVNYTVSCSGDVTCPPNFTTTDNTTRSYTITNLTPMTNYTFSVVATNSIGSGEAGVVMIATPGEVTTCIWHSIQW